MVNHETHFANYLMDRCLEELSREPISNIK